MKFKERYTNTSKKETGKTEITNEAYAICELIEELIDQVQRKR